MRRSRERPALAGPRCRTRPRAGMHIEARTGPDRSRTCGACRRPSSCTRVPRTCRTRPRTASGYRSGSDLRASRRCRAAGSSAFQFLILSIGFVFLHGALHNIFLAVNRLKTEMMIFAAAAVLNIGLNLFVVPRYGIVGAAVVTALTELMTLVGGLIVINRIGVSFSLRPIWRPLVASLFMGGFLFLLGTDLGLIPQLATGGGIYLLALFILRGIPQDIRQVFSKAAI